MELGAIRSTSELGQAAGLAAARGREELGKNEFMKLMIAQFNNQDPLEPQKNEDFIAQLAQFSSLEGIQNLNSSVDAMAQAMRTSTTMQAASLVGRAVLAPADRALTDGSGLAGNIVNDQPDTEVVLEISGAAGNLIERRSLGPRPAGDVRFDWNGTNVGGEQLPAGVYRVRAYANTGDEPTQLTVELPELVSSISFDNGEARLNLAGGASVPLSQVRELQ